MLARRSAVILKFFDRYEGAVLLGVGHSLVATTASSRSVVFLVVAPTMSLLLVLVCLEKVGLLLIEG